MYKIVFFKDQRSRYPVKDFITSLDKKVSVASLLYKENLGDSRRRAGAGRKKYGRMDWEVKL